MKTNTAWVVSGTDTGIGKTVFSALLTKKMNGVYWKPIQAGLDACELGTSDRERVQKLSQLHPEKNFIPEAYVFEHSLSPYAASVIEGVEILTSRLKPPHVQRPLIIESAGGPMVPLTKNTLQIDLFEYWKIPVILCTRTALGTINHTLLAIESLQKRSIPIQGIVFIGEAQPFTEEFISNYTGVKKLGRLPFLSDLSALSKEEGLFDLYFQERDFFTENEELHLKQPVYLEP